MKLINNYFSEVSVNKLVMIIAMLFVAFYNVSFFENVINVYPLDTKNAGFVISLTVFVWSIIVLLFLPFCARHTVKPVLITFVLLSSLTAYFMDSYNVVIDEGMIINAIDTDVNESMDLLSVNLVLYFLILGLLPAYYIFKVKLVTGTISQEIKRKILVIIAVAVLLAVVIISFSKFYASFIREQKPLRYYSNPVYYIYSTGKIISKKLKDKNVKIIPVGRDAHDLDLDGKRELVILVIGETARADRFSLNNDYRQTNPLLEKQDVISLTNVYSCGTSTAESLPCMFSILERDNYSISKAANRENLLDVVKHAGVNVLWLDNNSSSKGIAERVAYQSYKRSDLNTICTPECRDEGMLVGLQEYIDSKLNGDVLIVLHQMGNHGPAYYKRYPDKFEKYKPTCKTNQLEACSVEEINNAYDNAILYTDYFLSEVIELLKKNASFKTTMFYISDHGESLGENGLYLHGMPYFMAPDAQIHVPAIFWFGDNNPVAKAELEKQRDKEYSHDNIFHTVLGLLEIETTIYQKNKDILAVSK